MDFLTGEGSNSLAVLPNVEVKPLADLFTKTWPKTYVSQQALTQRASAPPGSCASVSQYVSCGQEEKAMMGRQLFQQVFQVAARLDDYGEVEKKIEAKPAKMVDASKDSKVEKKIEAKPAKMVDASKDSKVEKKFEAKPAKMVNASKDSKGDPILVPLQAQAAPRAPASFRRAPTPFRARLHVENLLEVRDCRYTADLLTTRPPKEPVNARYQVVSEDGVQAWDEQLISFSPEGEAKFRFTVKDTALGGPEIPKVRLEGSFEDEFPFPKEEEEDKTPLPPSPAIPGKPDDAEPAQDGEVPAPAVPPEGPAQAVEGPNASVPGSTVCDKTSASPNQLAFKASQRENSGGGKGRGKGHGKGRGRSTNKDVSKPKGTNKKRRKSKISKKRQHLKNVKGSNSKCRTHESSEQDEPKPRQIKAKKGTDAHAVGEGPSKRQKRHAAKVQPDEEPIAAAPKAKAKGAPKAKAKGAPKAKAVVAKAKAKAKTPKPPTSSVYPNYTAELQEHANSGTKYDPLITDLVNFIHYFEMEEIDSLKEEIKTKSWSLMGEASKCSTIYWTRAACSCKLKVDGKTWQDVRFDLSEDFSNV
eukprot:symbB.v1.2.037865.t1/scaffold5714.1/size24303/1